MIKSFFFFVLFFISVMSYSQDSIINLRLTPGDYFIKATKKANAGIAMVLVGALISTLPLAAGMDKQEALSLASIGGISVIIGFSLNISAWQQFGKAGRLMKEQSSHKSF